MMWMRMRADLRSKICKVLCHASLASLAEVRLIYWASKAFQLMMYIHIPWMNQLVVQQLCIAQAAGLAGQLLGPKYPARLMPGSYRF